MIYYLDRSATNYALFLILVTPRQLLVRNREPGTLLCNASAPFTEDDLHWVKLSASSLESIDEGGPVCRSFDTEGTSGSGSGNGFGGDDLVDDFVAIAALLEGERVVANGSVLNFTSVMFGDEGAYVCLVGRNMFTDCYAGAPVIGQSSLRIDMGKPLYIICTMLYVLQYPHKVV